MSILIDDELNSIYEIARDSDKSNPLRTIRLICEILEKDPYFDFQGEIAVDFLLKTVRRYQKKIKNNLNENREEKAPQWVWKPSNWEELLCGDIMDSKPLVINSEKTLAEAVFVGEALQSRHWIIVDSDGVFIDLLTYQDICRKLSTESHIANKKISEIHTLYQIAPAQHIVFESDSVKNAITRFTIPQRVLGLNRSGYLSTLVVLDDERRFKGVISYLSLLQLIKKRILPLRNIDIKSLDTWKQFNQYKIEVQANEIFTKAHTMLFMNNALAIIVNENTQQQDFLGLLYEEDLYRAFQFSKETDDLLNIKSDDPRVVTFREELETLRPDSRLSEALNLFLHKPYPRVLPVLVGKSCEGLLNYFDVFCAIVNLD